MIELKDIQYRIDRVIDGKGSTLLVYIDARTAREELNNGFGFGNWQFSYTVNDDKSVHGVLKIKEGEWLEFHDVGYCTNSYSTEPLKDAVSDATKRCAVQVGIGAFLYDAPFLWATWEQLKLGSNGKPTGLNDDGDKIIRGRIENWYNNLFPSKGDLDIRQIKNG